MCQVPFRLSLKEWSVTRQRVARSRHKPERLTRLVLNGVLSDWPGGRTEPRFRWLHSHTSCSFRSNWVFNVRFDFSFIGPHQFYTLAHTHQSCQLSECMCVFGLCEEAGVSGKVTARTSKCPTSFASPCFTFQSHIHHRSAWPQVTLTLHTPHQPRLDLA